MSYNAVLTDRKDEQVLPITTAENVFYNGSKTVKQAIDDIIAGRGGTGSGISGAITNNANSSNANFPIVGGIGGEPVNG